MPAIKKPMDLYLAKSLTELRNKANSNIESSISSIPPKKLANSARSLYVEGIKLLDKDEEKAYVILFRCASLAEHLRKNYKGEPDLTLDVKKHGDVLTSLERLTSSLEERYKRKSQVLNDHGKMVSVNGEIKLPSVPSMVENKAAKLSCLPEPSLQIQNGTHKIDNVCPKNTIGSIELYEKMHDKKKSLVIFDCRPKAHFNECHINHPSCVSIPEEVLRPGITAAALGALLNGEAKAMWNKRSLVDYVVLMDDDSCRGNMYPHSALNSLNLAIYKWETNNLLKKEPLILDNGFQEWMIHYPTTVTKVPSISSNSLNNLEFRNSLPYIDVEYPDFDEIVSSSDKGLMNVGFHEASPTKASSPLVLQSSENGKEVMSAFSIEKNVENPFISGLKPRAGSANQVPMFDRKNKPKGVVVPKPREAWEEESKDSLEEVHHKQQSLAESHVNNSKERLKQERAFEELRQRRETEANQLMLEEIQRKEEELLTYLQSLEESNRALEEKWKASEEEKEALKKKLQIDKEDKRHHDELAEKQEAKRKMDAEVDRLRQERKKRERQEKEKEEMRLAAERLKLEEKRVPEVVPTSADVPARPNTAPSSKSQGVVPVSKPAVPPQKRQDSSGVYSVRLKEEPSTNRSLSRSHSSPNIAQLLAEEDQKMAAGRTSMVTPASNKVFKQSTLGEECSPSINRALKPTDTNTARMRNFSPVFSSQPNTQTGLKNLGNTCFMNSVLQCLSHTRPLSAYLRSGNYVNDIVRSSTGGSRGEVIQELALVFQNLCQTFRNISPHEFKNTVSRYMSVCEGYEQQDAHEFLVVLMERLHTETNKGVSSKGPSPPDLEKISCAEEALNIFWIWHLKIHSSCIVQLFEGVLQSRLTCCVCNHRAYTYEVFSCLSLPIPSPNKCSIKDCIQSLLKAEMMRGEAAWNCPNCKRKQEAEKKMGICRLPPILIIHLKRFSYEGLWRRKLVTIVDFPTFDLDMEPYLIVPTKKSRYNLYGVVNHYGTLEGGHYTAYCKSDTWSNFDDHEVQQISQASVKTSAAYILFYSSVDQSL